MSVESARVFCVRMMSDEDFRGQLLAMPSAADVRKMVSAEYEMTKEDLIKAISGFVGHSLSEDELAKLLGEFIQEQTENENVCKIILEWVNSLN